MIRSVMSWYWYLLILPQHCLRFNLRCIVVPFSSFRLRLVRLRNENNCFYQTHRSLTIQRVMLNNNSSSEIAKQIFSQIRRVQFPFRNTVHTLNTLLLTNRKYWSCFRGYELLHGTSFSTHRGRVQGLTLCRTHELSCLSS